MSKVKIPSRSKRTEGRDRVNKALGAMPRKVWYELITNIPVSAKWVHWTIMRSDNPKGLKVVYRQDAPGPTMELLSKNMDSATVDDQGNITTIEKPDSSSIYGSGFTTMGDYCSSLITYSTPEDGESFSWDEKTGEVGDIEPLEECGFMIEMVIDHDSKMGSYVQFVERLRLMISELDAIPMSEGREHKFSVQGIGKTKTDDTELCKVIEPKLIQWVDEAGTPTNGPEFTTIDSDSGWVDKLVVDTHKGGKMTINIKAVGKRHKDWKLEGFSGDKPVLIVYYKGTKQIAFIVLLRSGNNETSLNNKVIIGEISTTEVASYMVGADKMLGLQEYAIEAIFDTFRKSLLKMYPEVNMVEEMLQDWGVEMIVNDYMGKESADSFRAKFGLSAMDDMSPEDREDCVDTEVSKANGRYDIIIARKWEPTNEDGHFKKTLIEVKRTGYGRNDRNQLFAYALKDEDVDSIGGLTTKVSSDAKKGWSMDRQLIEETGRLKDVYIAKKLVDGNVHGFNVGPIFSHFLDVVRKKRESK